MALWNKVFSCFDYKEETVDFGRRTVIENDGSLYETSTIATIQSTEKVVKEPNVLASVQYSRVCVIIDKSVTIFQNETCKEILLNVNFESMITCYCISDNGLFLFVVLSSGVLYCLNLLNNGQVIFTKDIKDGHKIITIFLQNVGDECNIYLIAKNGAVYRVSQLNNKLVKPVIQNETNSNIKIGNLTEEIQCVQLFKGFYDEEVICATVGMTNRDISIAMLCPSKLFMWPTEQYNNFKSSSNYIKVKFFRNHVAMLCLREDRILKMICPQTLLGVYMDTIHALDFTIIENNDNSSCQILVLAESDDNCIGNTVRVLSFPEFEEKFRITVPITTYLVEIMDPCDEIILYLEGVNDLRSNTNYIDTIRIKTVSESIPEYQLQRLLRMEQFDAAEALAKKFNLSTEPIYCKKATLILSQLEPWAKKNCVPIQLDMLFSILDKIKNVQFIVECCSKALIPDYKQMRKIHVYARSRIIESTTKTKSNENLNLLYLINNMLHKLETFHMIWECKKKSQYYDDVIMKEWIRFQQANFVEEYKTYINLGEMEVAALIWTRHLPEIIKYVSVKAVKDIFALIPENTSSAVLWPWLSHFIPTLLSCVPSAMCEIICWGCKKVKLFEKTHYSEWPRIGIDFANRFIKLLKFEENHQSLYFHQGYLSNDSSLKQLILLTQTMSDIQKLKINYRLTVPLNLYNGDPMEVSHMLLDRVHVDIIPEFVNTFLKQYMLNNSLKNDYVFTLYIQKTMRNSRSWSGEESIWEEKIIVIIDLIQNIETKLQQVLEVLKNVSVPWSPTIKNLAETSSTVDHILASQIRTECNYVPIKLILKKYGYERIGINDRLVHRIIKENHDEMISHIQCITKNDPLLRKNAFSFCINYYLSKGNFTKVMEILNSLEREVLLYCCIQIVNYVISSLRLKTVPESLAYYIEMLGWVKLQLGKLSKECKTHSNYCNHIINNIDEVKSIYFLKKDYQISITFHEYQTDKEQILQRYIEELCKVEMKENNDLITCKKVIKVAELLKLQKTNAISLLLNCTKNVNLFNYFFKYEKESFHLLTDECQYIYKICSIILQYAKMDVDIAIAIAIRNLSSSALCVCLDDDLQSMLLLYNWINLYQQCLSEKIPYNSNSTDKKQNEILKSNWKLYTIYKDLAITTDESLLPLFRNIISIQKFYITKFISDTELNKENPLEKLLDNIKKLEVKHNDYCLLQMIKTLYFSFYVRPNIDVTLLSEITSVYFRHLIILLKKVISTRSFDLQLGLSCLFMLSESEAYKWISIAYKSFQPDCTQHLRISVLGYEYFRLLQNETSIQIFKTNKMMHCWALKLSKYSISYKEVLTGDATTQREILQHIMSCNDDDIIDLLQHFCTDFGFDTQDCLLLYLQTVIKTWNPKFIIKDLSGKKELHINEDEVNELRKKCNVIAAIIEDKAALTNCVKTIFSQINFYYYEIFIILMDLIKDKSTEHRNYILFLQNYMRTSQPTQIESDKWIHLNPGYTSLPPIAKWRLPFLPKVELWTLISPELNLKTYEKWLDIAPILKLQSHIVCTLAIKGEVRHVWGNKRETDKWTLYPKNTTLLSDIKRCIERMTGPDALYYGTAALYYVVNHTPPGADQVAAVDECYKYAQLSAQKSTVFEEGMLEKIKFKYLRFTSEHILRTHGLEKKKYLELIGNPFKLVHELYSDESIPQRYRCVIIDHRPDINSAVDYISQLFSINIIKLRVELLQEWLQPDVKYIKFNQSITDTFSMMINSESNSNCDDNLLRACYILEYGDIELPANFLINICFVDKNEDYSAEVRYRALRVLQMILDTAKLEELTKRDYQTIRNYMKSLIYISRLELLGISYSIKEFETCSKYELVQILWKTQNYTPQALVIISQLCIDFEIYEYSLWDKSLTQLAKLSMINELKKILLQVRNVSAIVNSNGYLLGWQVVILEPFRKMDVHPTNEQIDNCIEALQLLYSCPVVHMLCFSDIIKYCFQCQQPHFAVALLPFLHGDDKKNVLEQSKKDFDVAKILQDLNSLSLNGILCVPYVSMFTINLTKVFFYI
ncbi:kinetochore-associated protein 1 isoform X1 [Osmia bicornis bicornis]|uniref:kinetochore-associated protein 1 isoform X1 n=1 Tax=Osmia bicornis bicornis TaxID=1437191 RepID=UPI001EAEE701|nr:kinetochore-associated protein 1 isoform X1 [Osmia bicornis bicornis]